MRDYLEVSDDSTCLHDFSRLRQTKRVVVRNARIHVIQLKCSETKQTTVQKRGFSFMRYLYTFIPEQNMEILVFVCKRNEM